MDCHYAYDSIITKAEDRNLPQLVSTASELVCELRIAQGLDAWETKEGYSKHRYVVSAPSELVFEQFKNKVSEQIEYNNWFFITQEQFSEIFFWNNEYLPTFQEVIKESPLYYGSMLDGLRAAGYANEKLRTKLNTETPLYYGHDWIIPATSRECGTWLDGALTAVGRLGVGRSLRIAEIGTTNDGFHVQKFALRIFSDGDLRKFIQSIEALSPLNDWHPVPESAFLEGMPLYHDRLAGFVFSLKDNIEANAELKERLP